MIVFALCFYPSYVWVSSTYQSPFQGRFSFNF